MLELKNISYSVKSENCIKKYILKKISIKFDSNKTYCITGPNGSGKSTLAKIIMGVIQPTSGSILLDGKDITNLDITSRAKLGISFAFQQPVRFKGITVRDLISLSAGVDVEMSQACKYLSDVGLCARDYINREVDGSLSGGELKRIEIAQMIARNSKVTIFDEPEAGIDLWSFNNLISVFEKMGKNMNGLKIIISHQEKLINYADQVIVLDSGEVMEIGTPKEALKRTTAKKMCKVMEDK